MDADKLLESVSPVSKLISKEDDKEYKKRVSGRRSRNISNSSNDTSGVEYLSDEGELKSEEESIAEGSDSSEEGEILSEVDEAEVSIERPPKKDETAWERGLRLARERMEKVKATKAAEKDLLDKRMNLPVPVSMEESDLEETAMEDILWPYYYQACIIGRTELTCRRFVPEDLQPPVATELAEWRLSLSDSRRTTRGRRYQRRSHRASSESGSSVNSSASRVSAISSDSDSSSVASSLLSVAASWKATCAKAMKDYLSSPIRNKDRRTGRYHAHRESGSESSDSNSRSSDSASGSDRSRDRQRDRGRYRRGGPKSSGYNWPDQKKRSKRSHSDSDRSSASRSGSRSSEGSGTRRTRGGYTAEVQNTAQDGWKDYSESPNERRSEVLPLPHERPIKRPWAAAPGLAEDIVMSNTNRAPRDRSRSSSRSRSVSSPAAEERQFITSWSKSPSPTRQRRPKPRLVHRQRLPDVVPGDHSSRADTPEWQSESRGRHAQIDRHTIDATALDGYPLSQTNAPEERREYVTQPKTDMVRHATTDASASSHVPSTHGGGELPSNRPGVKLTLAPRLKASTVDMTNLPGVSRGSVNRPASPPRLPRLPFPLTAQHRGTSPVSISQQIVEGPQPLTADQEEIRRQAEVVAKVVEARERRRAAVEAARRRLQPKKKKNDLSDIPLRGRPTYRRVSFSESSASSASSSRSSKSRSKSGSPSEARSLKPMESQYEPIIQRHHKSHKKVRTEVQFDYSRIGEAMDAYNHPNRQAIRNVPPLGYQKDVQHRKLQSRSKPQFDESIMRVRPNRQPRYDQFPPEKQLYMDYVEHAPPPPVRTGAAPRFRDIRQNFNTVYPGPGYVGDPVQRHDFGNRRRPAPPPSFDRSGRPRTPHADTDQQYFMRSPHAIEPQSARGGRTDRKRFDDRNQYTGHGEPRRKRAMIMEPVIEPSTNESMLRARSRHRSRGPGAPIDRSEPFESDAGGYAAELRLRQLRERLNLVDDAIAELKAGSNVGYTEARR